MSLRYDSGCNKAMDFIPEFLDYGGIDFSSKAAAKATKYFMERYIHDVEIHGPSENQSEEQPCSSSTPAAMQCVIVTGKCYRSMKKSDPPHRMEIRISGRAIIDTGCNCKAGVSGVCSHILGLVKTIQFMKLNGMKQVPTEMACTSLPQAWHVPRGEKILPMPVNSIIAANPRVKRKRDPSIPRPSMDFSVTHEFLTKVDKLRHLKGTPFEFLAPSKILLVRSESGQGYTQVGSVACYQSNITFQTPQQGPTTGRCNATLLPRKPPISIQPQFSHLKHLKSITLQQAAALEERTRDQASSQVWVKERKQRLTASQFGRILKRQKTPSDIFLKSIFSANNIQAAAVKYGRAKEPIARRLYCQKQNVHTHACGLIINPEFPFLGATPDAKVCDQNEFGLLEIKCPYSARDLTVRDGVARSKIKWLLYSSDEGFTMKTSSEYYFQIQGQMLLSGAPWCDLAVYTSIDLVVVRVLPDIPMMTDILSRLCTFYDTYCLPYLQIPPQAP